MEKDKYVDESWKESVAGQQDEEQSPEAETPDEMEINFLNYITSLGFQAMIFLGAIPNPMTNESDKNLPQAKFLIDTLVMLREKTNGNLTKPESDMLNGSIYELQMKFVEASKNTGQGPQEDGS